ncbi:MAG: polymer-forming cytoskeletal protein [Bacteroidales bacterium]|nr:polymer-forming cytoskeletal protein [Bacteroidales bacterium]
MARTMETETLESINIITKGTVIKGDVTSTGDFRLDGTLEGNIQLNGKLVVGDTGIVNGNILCMNANIIGTVNGNLSVKELLSLHATARVKGDILINKLSIEPGAVFTGKCCMLDEVRKQQQLDAEHAAAEQAAAEHMANED